MIVSTKLNRLNIFNLSIRQALALDCTGSNYSFWYRSPTHYFCHSLNFAIMCATNHMFPFYVVDEGKSIRLNRKQCKMQYKRSTDSLLTQHIDSYDKTVNNFTKFLSC